jgi:hypothetical protein
MPSKFNDLVRTAAGTVESVVNDALTSSGVKQAAETTATMSKHIAEVAALLGVFTDDVSKLKLIDDVLKINDVIQDAKETGPLTIDIPGVSVEELREDIRRKLKGLQQRQPLPQPSDSKRNEREVPPGRKRRSRNRRTSRRQRTRNDR